MTWDVAIARPPQPLLLASAPPPRYSRTLPMWLGLAVIGVLLLSVFAVIALQRVLVARRCLRLINAIRWEKHDAGGAATMLLDWLHERPSRSQQKNLFIEFTMAHGMSEIAAVDAALGCIVRSWTPDGEPFGRALASEISRRTGWAWVDSTDPAKHAVQLYARIALTDIKARLIALD
jgi:hypothetical protein